MNSSMIAVVTICPGCFAHYAPGTISAEYPICPECSSEATEVELIPHADFMDRLSLADLEQIKERWSRREDLLPNYKQAVLKRVEEIIREKRLAVRQCAPR